jgi:diacylglycerol kinase (ATP)
VRLAAIVNPAAGRGAAARRWPPLEAALRSHFADMPVYSTRGPGDAERLAAALAAERCERLVVAGGDGTLNEVLNGLMRQPEPRPALAIVPTGSAADYARLLNLPHEPRELALRIAEGTPRRVDIGRATLGGGEPRYFLNMASAGLGAEVVGSRAFARLRPLGSPAYLVTAAVALARRQARPAVIEVGETRLELPLTHVAIGCGAFQGGGLRMCPAARLDDGLFEVTVIGTVGLGDLLTNVPLLFNGRLGTHPQVTMLRGRRVRVKAAAALAAELDGEAAGTLPFEAEVIPGAISLLAG